MKLRLRLAALCAAALCSSAFAGTSTYSFNGVVDANNTGQAYSNFSGVFSFDAAKPDQNPGDDHEGAYPMNGGPWGMQVTFNDGTVFDVDAAVRYSLSVHVPLPSPGEGTLDTGRFIVKGNVTGQSDRFLSLDFTKAFTSDALPAPDGGFVLSTFDEALFTYNGLPSPAPSPGQDPVPAFGAFGHLTELRCIGGCPGGDVPLPAVPEPASCALLLAGLGAIGWVARRREPRA